MTAETEGYELTAGEVPAAPESALAALRAKRKKTRESLHVDLAIPRYDSPELFVRFKPVPQRRLVAANKAAEKSREQDKIVLGNAAILAEACLGIFLVNEAGDAVSLDPEGSADPDTWPRFDDRLIELLELECGPRAAEVVREVFFTDGDIIATCDKLARWSGFAETDLERDVEGN